MTITEIKIRYNHLTSDELKAEIEYRTTHPYDYRMVGADGCMTDAYVIRVCKELLSERQFITDIYFNARNNGDGLVKITLSEAETNLREWKDCGVEVPESMTAVDLMNAWNYVV